MAPVAEAGFAANEANVRAHGENAAAAACQILVLVNVVLILEVEDSLGLVAGEPHEPIAIRAPENSSLHGGSLAECSSILRKLRIVYEGDGAAPIATYVSGPPLVTASEGAVLTNAASVSVDEGSSAALCQHLVLVGSTVIGGGAYGIPVGSSSSILELTNRVLVGSGTTSLCETVVEDVEVVSGTA